MIYMGEAELKKFIALLALANLQQGEADERLRLALVRARFCDQLAQQKKLAENPPSAFLTGLFSNVHELVEQPQSELLAQLPLQHEIKGALLTKSGMLGMFLQLTQAFEQADWPLTTDLEQQITGLSELAQLYLDAVSWAEAILPR
jgi:EAL and modified HD-GYP domain-containing signal transduction protein